ncbi:putative quinol monooxygenase [Sphingomonas sp. OTU376]|uniref:putative quinol monooxygenase n=1 Tax=Sphingomonas sp. OTU376 TaxID=3043863 RepID=UPI00313E2C03
MTGTLHVAASFRAKPGCSAQLGDRLRALVAPTRREAGSLRYHVLQGLDDTDAWLVSEEWADRRAFDEHMAQPYVLDLLAAAPALCAQEPRIAFFKDQSSF